MSELLCIARGIEPRAHQWESPKGEKVEQVVVTSYFDKPLDYDRLALRVTKVKYCGPKRIS